MSYLNTPYAHRLGNLIPTKKPTELTYRSAKVTAYCVDIPKNIAYIRVTKDHRESGQAGHELEQKLKILDFDTSIVE